MRQVGRKKKRSRFVKSSWQVSGELRGEVQVRDDEDDSPHQKLPKYHRKAPDQLTLHKALRYHSIIITSPLGM